jgi:hypothetical protein
MRVIVATGLVITIGLFVLLSSCDRTDDAQQQRIRAENAARQYMVEAQISLVEHPTTNSSNFLIWLRSYAAATNRVAKELRLVCDTIWVNTNFNDWSASTNRSHNSEAIAIVARYNGIHDHCFIGIAFDGKSAQTNAKPSSGFTEINVKALR